MVLKWLLLLLLTILPLVELRLSIPIGILTGTISLPFGISVSGLGLNPLLVFLTATITNILLGFFLINVIYSIDKKIRKSRINGTYARFMDKSKRKLKPYVEKYGILGVSIFIGLPVPGSGVYVGSLGAFMIGMDKKDFYKASVLGVLIAATIVTALTLGISLF